MGDSFDSDSHGPLVIPLFAMPENEMFGRSGFLIHGDSVEHPGNASEGCIIAAKVDRLGIIHTGERLLVVY